MDENPYQPPHAASSEIRRLDRRRHKVLQFYWQHRDAPLTSISLVGRVFPIWLSFAALTAVGIWLCWQIGADNSAFAFLGLLAGLILRDLGWVGQIRKNWPIVKSVLNWDEIERQLAGAIPEPVRKLV
jgi:hypothetical protein